jgi:hypothetical protein
MSHIPQDSIALTTVTKDVIIPPQGAAEEFTCSQDDKAYR